MDFEESLTFEQADRAHAIGEIHLQPRPGVEVHYRIVRELQHALRARFPQHKRIVAWTWPIWLYVSVSGVIVYLMLYHLAPTLHS